MFCGLTYNYLFWAVGWNILHMSGRFFWSILLFKSTASLLIFCLEVVSIIEGGILMIPVMISSCLFLPSVCLWFTYLWAFMLGAHIFNGYVFLMSWFFYHHINFFVSCDRLYLYYKSTLCDIGIATPFLFWLPFVWNIFFHPFFLSPCVSLNPKWVSHDSI